MGRNIQIVWMLTNWEDIFSNRSKDKLATPLVASKQQEHLCEAATLYCQRRTSLSARTDGKGGYWGIRGGEGGEVDRDKHLSPARHPRQLLLLLLFLSLFIIIVLFVVVFFSGHPLFFSLFSFLLLPFLYSTVDRYCIASDTFCFLSELLGRKLSIILFSRTW